MGLLENTIADLGKYWEYILNSINTEIRTEYSTSYVGYLWWILDPLLYMVIYIVVVTILLGRRPPDYPVFLFTGLLFWRWTSSAFIRCTNSIISKRNLLAQVYIPKFIFPLVRVVIESIYFLFSIFVLFALLIIYKIPFTLHFLEFVPLFFVQFLFIFGMGLWLSHLGAYYYDVDRVLSFILRVWYYVSPGLYSLASVPESYRHLFWLNPLTTIMESSRNVFLYGKSPVYPALAGLAVLSLVIIYFGLKKLREFDRVYTKVF